MAARLTMASVALGLARSGFHVFPLRPGSKEPATRDGLKSATLDRQRIKAWWGTYPEMNIGIHCGRSGLVVIDLDAGKPWPLDTEQPEGVKCGADVLAAIAGELPTTATVLTPSGGLHLYFRAPAGAAIGNSAGRLGPWIDVRAGEGYVVAPWSRTAAGHYRASWGWHSMVSAKAREYRDDFEPHGKAVLESVKAELAELPTAIRERIEKRPTAEPDPIEWVMERLRAPRVSGGYAAAALAGELERVRSARIGTRNVTLNRAAYCLGQLVGAGLLDEDDVVEALLAVGREVGLDERELIGEGHRWGTIGSGLTAGKRSPREVGGVAG